MAARKAKGADDADLARALAAAQSVLTVKPEDALKALPAASRPGPPPPPPPKPVSKNGKLLTVDGREHRDGPRPAGGHSHKKSGNEDEGVDGVYRSNIGGGLSAWIRKLSGNGEELAKYLIEVITNPNEKAQDRLRAVELAADRGWGKAVQPVEQNHTFANPLLLRIAGCSDDELKQLDDPERLLPDYLDVDFALVEPQPADPEDEAW